MVDNFLKKRRRTCFVWTSSPSHFCPQFALAILIERHHPPWANLISSCVQLRGKLLLCRTICTHDHAQHRVTVLSPSILYPFKSFEDQDTQGQPVFPFSGFSLNLP